MKNKNITALFMGGTLISLSLFFSRQNFGNILDGATLTIEHIVANLIGVTTRLILTGQVVPFLIGTGLCISFFKKNKYQ